MILSERDLMFLEDLHMVKMLNTNRISKLYKSNEYAYKRLRLLKENQFIKITHRLPNKENVFSLDKQGYEVIGKKDEKHSVNLKYQLAYADFYFYEKRLNAFTKFNNNYYFTFQQRKYVLKIDVLIRTTGWGFVEIDLGDKHFEDKISKVEKYYESKEHKKLFDKFPSIVIVSTNVNRSRALIEEIRNKKLEICYTFVDFDKVKNWEYIY